MEHRNGRRIPIQLNVQLWSGDTHCGTYISSDIGYGGLRLKVSPDVIKEGDFLSAKIKTGQPNQEKEHDLKLMAVHQSERGLGLMWAGCDEPFFYALDTILTAAR